MGNGPVTSGLDNAARYAGDYIDQNGNTQSTTVSGYQTENGDVFLKFPNGIQTSSVTVKSMVGDGYSDGALSRPSKLAIRCKRAIMVPRQSGGSKAAHMRLMQPRRAAGPFWCGKTPLGPASPYGT